MVFRALSFLGRRNSPVLTASIFVGVAFGAPADRCKSALVPSVNVLLTRSVAHLDWQRVLITIRRLGPAPAAVFWLLLAVPVVMTAAARLLGLPPALTAGRAVMAAAPPIISSVAFLLLFGLDAALAALALYVG